MPPSSIARHRPLIAVVCLASLALAITPASAQVPPEIPAEGLVLYLEADSINAADGASIDRWPDRSGNGHDAVQDDATRRPKLVRDGVGGRPAVRFDADDDGMLIADAVALGDRFTVIVVDAYSARGERKGPTVQGRSEAFSVGRRHGRIGVYRNQWVNDAERDGYSRMPGAYDVTVAVGNGETIECFINGADHTYKPIAPHPPGRLALGAAGRIGEGADADIAALIVYNRALDWHERRAIEKHLMPRYAVPAGPRMRDVRLRNADNQIIAHFDRPIHAASVALREAVTLEPPVAAITHATVEGDTLILSIDKPVLDARFAVKGAEGAVRDAAGAGSVAFEADVLGEMTARMNIAYSPAASAQLGGKLAENVATHVTHMNTALRQSEVPIRIEVAHVYVDPKIPDVSSGTVIENFRRDHATWVLINRYGADVAVAISGYRNCGGRAYRGYPQAPFAALAVSCGAADGRSVFAHESGHIFGADHALGYCIGTNYRIAIPDGVVRSRTSGKAAPAIAATKFVMPAEYRDSGLVAAAMSADRRTIRLVFSGHLHSFVKDARAAVRLADSADGPFKTLGEGDSATIPDGARDVLEIQLAVPRAGAAGVWVMIEPKAIADFGGQVLPHRIVTEALAPQPGETPRLLYTSMAHDRNTSLHAGKAVFTLVFDQPITAAAAIRDAVRFSHTFGEHERPLGEGGSAVVPDDAPHTLVVTVPNPGLDDRHTLLPSGARNRIPAYSNPRVQYKGMPMGDVDHDNAAVMASLAETYSRLRPDPAAAVHDAPPRLEMSVKAGQRVERTFTITNAAETSRNRELAFDAASDRPWLSATPATGDIAPGASATVTIRADAASLAPGEHAGTVQVTHSGGWDRRAIISVTLRVTQ